MEREGERRGRAPGLERFERRPRVLDEERGVGVGRGLLEELDGAAEGEAGPVALAVACQLVGRSEDEKGAGYGVIVRGAAGLEVGVGCGVAEPLLLDRVHEARG